MSAATLAAAPAPPAIKVTVTPDIIDRFARVLSGVDVLRTTRGSLAPDTWDTAPPEYRAPYVSAVQALVQSDAFVDFTRSSAATTLRFVGAQWADSGYPQVTPTTIERWALNEADHLESGRCPACDGEDAPNPEAVPA